MELWGVFVRLMVDLRYKQISKLTEYFTLHIAPLVLKDLSILQIHYFSTGVPREPRNSLCQMLYTPIGKDSSPPRMLRL